jgi:hypothetical protein
MPPEQRQRMTNIAGDRLDLCAHAQLLGFGQD